MAIDTATKRRAAAHIGVPIGLGVTPDATPEYEWRASVSWSYYLEAAPVSHILSYAIIELEQYSMNLEVREYTAILPLPPDGESRNL